MLVACRVRPRLIQIRFLLEYWWSFWLRSGYSGDITAMQQVHLVIVIPCKQKHRKSWQETWWVILSQACWSEQAGLFGMGAYWVAQADFDMQNGKQWRTKNDCVLWQILKCLLLTFSSAPPTFTVTCMPSATLLLSLPQPYTMHTQ